MTKKYKNKDNDTANASSKLTDSGTQELRQVLDIHFSKYKHMGIRDLIKLVFQNEFGGGHIIENKAESLKHLLDEIGELRKEYEKKVSVNKYLDLNDGFEYIGNKLYRYNLKSYLLNEKGTVLPETLNNVFCHTANSVSCEKSRFEEKLSYLRKYLEEYLADNDSDFTLQDFDNYIKEYKSKGYPVVSHSGSYKEKYHPAYRVVGSFFYKYFNVFQSIDILSQKKSSVLVAIEGNSTAGKSHLARLLSSVYDCNVIKTDDFFLQKHQRTQERLTETGGNIDCERFKSEISDNIGKGRAFSYRPYDCRKKSLGDPVKVYVKKLNVIEGSYSLHPVMGTEFDLKIFLETDIETQKERVLSRNGPEMYERFENEWIPMENKYFKEFQIKEKCDLVYKN